MTSSELGRTPRDPVGLVCTVPQARHLSISGNGRADRRLVALIALPILAFFAYSSWPSSFNVSLPSPDVTDIKKIISNRAKGACFSLCESRRQQRIKHFNVASRTRKDFLEFNPRDLLGMVEQAKERLLDKLYVDYGQKYFNDMFVDENGKYRPIYPATANGHSLSTLKRRLQIKVLSALVSARQQESNVDNECNCLSKQPIQKDVNKTSKQAIVETLFEKYVWATGGHSAAAGHGNMYNESYTAFMERDLVDVFGSIGIKFEGRNYAMGGSSSSPELAVCWEEIFGNDADMFTWDFGMTDGQDTRKLFFYGYRGGSSKGHPTFVGLNLGPSRMRKEAIVDLEHVGMGVFFADHNQGEKQRLAIPDSLNMSEKEIDTLPEYVKSFKCGNDNIENGNPPLTCKGKKYTSYACPDRPGKAAWHPG